MVWSAGGRSRDTWRSIAGLTDAKGIRCSSSRTCPRSRGCFTGAATPYGSPCDQASTFLHVVQRHRLTRVILDHEHVIVEFRAHGHRHLSFTFSIRSEVELDQRKPVVQRLTSVLSLERANRPIGAEDDPAPPVLPRLLTCIVKVISEGRARSDRSNLWFFLQGLQELIGALLFEDRDQTIPVSVTRPSFNRDVNRRGRRLSHRRHIDRECREFLLARIG